MSEDVSILPSQNPGAREALFVFGLLPAGHSVQAWLRYGRDDTGRVHFDDDRVPRPIDPPPEPAYTGLLVDAFEKLLEATQAGPMNLYTARQAAAVLELLDIQVIFSPHLPIDDHF